MMSALGLGLDKADDKREVAGLHGFFHLNCINLLPHVARGVNKSKVFCGNHLYLPPWSGLTCLTEQPNEGEEEVKFIPRPSCKKSGGRFSRPPPFGQLAF